MRDKLARNPGSRIPKQTFIYLERLSLIMKRGLINPPIRVRDKEINELEKRVENIYFGLEYLRLEEHSDEEIENEFYESLDAFIDYSKKIVESDSLYSPISLIFRMALFGNDYEGKTDEDIKLQLSLLNNELGSLDSLEEARRGELVRFFIGLQSKIWSYYSYLNDLDIDSHPNRKYASS
ncbi:MAG: hypothetical protein ACFFG0_47150 [Candidatus Thorarchaeota archaeon]